MGDNHSFQNKRHIFYTERFEIHSERFENHTERFVSKLYTFAIKELELWYEKSVTIFSFLGLKRLKMQSSIPFNKEFALFLASFLTT